MKISLVDDTIYGYAAGDPSVAGGAERYMWLQTRALVAAGWSATLGTWTALKPGQRETIDGVEFVGLERTHSVRAVARFLAAEKPDWCHWFGSNHLLGPAAALGRLRGVRTVFSAQFDNDVRPMNALAGRRYLWPFYAAGLWASDRIFLQHGGQLAELPSSLQEKAFIVPGIVEVPTSSVDHRMRKPYVAWVGVLRQPKRPDLLIDIAERSPGVEFVVCGGPSSGHRSPPGYSEAIIERFGRVANIRYMGHVAPDQAIKVISGASLLLSTSDAEGFPSVFVEAWASGTPVVTLRIDPDGVIARQRLGAACHGVAAAADTIGHLITSVGERQEMAARCREHVIRRHSADSAVAVVQEALNGRTRRSLRDSQLASGR
jgi:glycosyltransferase involved in cell wall biosynthesis